MLQFQNGHENKLADSYTSGRLRNSLKAQSNQFQYHVSITSSSAATQSLYVCSGSLIAAQWVLTAASCTVRHQRYDLRFDSVTFYTGGVTLTSHVAIPHPNYNPRTRVFDAALIALPRALTSQESNSRVIALPSLPQINSNVNFANQFARTTGFGRIGDYQSPVLQFENVRVIENSDNACRNTFNSNNITNAIQLRFLCASEVHHGPSNNNCTGDVGSPIFVTENNNRLVQVGIAIFDADHRGCVGSTSIYTRLTEVARWIRTIAPGV